MYNQYLSRNGPTKKIRKLQNSRLDETTIIDKYRSNIKRTKKLNETENTPKTGLKYNSVSRRIF